MPCRASAFETSLPPWTCAMGPAYTTCAPASSPASGPLEPPPAAGAAPGQPLAGRRARLPGRARRLPGTDPGGRASAPLCSGSPGDPRARRAASVNAPRRGSPPRNGTMSAVRRMLGVLPNLPNPLLSVLSGPAHPALARAPPPRPRSHAIAGTGSSMPHPGNTPLARKRCKNPATLQGRLRPCLRDCRPPGATGAMAAAAPRCSTRATK